MTFPADESQPTPTLTVDAPIQIFDDDVDEAEFQVFIAYLELVSAMKEETVQLITIMSSCRIVDNDREIITMLQDIKFLLALLLQPLVWGWEKELKYTWTLLQIFKRNCSSASVHSS